MTLVDVSGVRGGGDLICGMNPVVNPKVACCLAAGFIPQDHSPYPQASLRRELAR